MCMLIQQNQTLFVFFVCTSFNARLWKQKIHYSFLIYVNLFWKLIQVFEAADLGNSLKWTVLFAESPISPAKGNMVWKLSILCLSYLEIKKSVLGEEGEDNWPLEPQETFKKDLVQNLE